MAKKIALAYVGAVVPDRPPFNDDAAFSRAGNMFQENLLAAMKESGLPPSLILSQRPLRAFPRVSVLWVSAEKAELPNNLSVDLLPFINLPILRPIIVGLAVVAHLIRWSWRQQKETRKVVYTYNLSEPPELFTFIGARLIRAKIIASVNDIYIPGDLVPNTVSRRLDFWLQKKLIPYLDGLVVVSEHIIKDFAPFARFIRIEGGVAQKVLERSAPFASRSKRIDAPFTIVSAGSLTEANGFVALLESFSLLDGKGYRLRIAGTGPLEERVKQAAHEDSRIEYCGYLDFDGVWTLYQSADVLINMRLTKKIKTDYFFPSKIFEYLASAVPVISTCTGHIEEEYADMVFLLREETPLALAQMIEQVAALPFEARARKGQTAREHIRTHNSWEVQGQRVVKFIQAIT